jgi:hypothetical protein
VGAALHQFLAQQPSFYGGKFEYLGHCWAQVGEKEILLGRLVSEFLHNVELTEVPAAGTLYTVSVMDGVAKKGERYTMRDLGDAKHVVRAGRRSRRLLSNKVNAADR